MWRRRCRISSAYPDIFIDLHLSDQAVELIGGGFDLALRIAAPSDSSMVARRLCQVRQLLVGAPDCFAGRGRRRCLSLDADANFVGDRRRPLMGTVVNGGTMR